MSLLRLPLARLRELLKEHPAEAKLARGAVCWLILRRGVVREAASLGHARRGPRKHTPLSFFKMGSKSRARASATATASTGAVNCRTGIWMRFH